MSDLARVASVLREQALGRRDALADEWGESPVLPPADAGPAPLVPETAKEFVAETYAWRVECAVARAGRVLAVRSREAWQLPGAYGRRGDAPAEIVVRAVRERTGVDCEVTGVAYTQLLEFDCEGERLPVLRAVFRAIPVSDPEDHEPGADWRPAASLADGDERDLLEAL